MPLANGAFLVFTHEKITHFFITHVVITAASQLQKIIFFRVLNSQAFDSGSDKVTTPFMHDNGDVSWSMRFQGVWEFYWFLQRLCCQAAAATVRIRR